MRDTFPEAVRALLKMDGALFKGRATVYFSTPDAAKAAAENGVTVDGHAIRLKRGGALVPSSSEIFF